MSKSRAKRNIEWIEKHCQIPEGKDVGKPVRLRKWQRAAILKIYDNPAGTRMAILSFGKKNAKTTLAAFLLLLHLCGPEAKRDSQLPSTAQSKEQAAVLFKLAAKIVRRSPTLRPVLVVRDTIKEIACPDLGTLYKALSSEAATAHGQSPIFAVHDELGQVKGPVSEMFNAIENAMGAHESPMSIVISTQAPTDADLLSVLIDDAIAKNDPKIVLCLYTADTKLDPFSKEAIKQANPAFGDFLNAKEVLDQAEKAKRMPSQEALYRNYTLNQRVEVSNPFITKSAWEACNSPVISSFKGLPVWAGLDLSEVSDLTALVLIAPVDGVWHVKPTFWLPGTNIRERATKDRVPYDVWEKQGFITKTEGPTVEYEYVAEYLWNLFQTLDIRKLAFDRWNWRHLKPWLLKIGFKEAQLEGDDAVFEQFGQGFQSMSPALRDLEAAILNEEIAHGGNPVLTMCMANATVQTDPAGNRKLSKMKSHGRIDGAIALAMAKSVAGTYKAPLKVDLSAWLSAPAMAV